MTRKTILTIILLIFIFGCFWVIFGRRDNPDAKVISVGQIKQLSGQLNGDVEKLQDLSTKEFENKKKELKKTIENYRNAKEEYEDIIPTEAYEELIELEESDLKDVYDVDFLWTILGNYATESGINLNFDIKRNTTSISSIDSNSKDKNYVMCDLEFRITGSYINLTDFIYDLEDDDRLNFEINDFKMGKDGNGLVVTLRVNEVKINASNLIEETETSVATDQNKENTTETSDNTTSNTTSENKTTENTTQTIDSNTIEDIN